MTLMQFMLGRLHGHSAPTLKIGLVDRSIKDLQKSVVQETVAANQATAARQREKEANEEVRDMMGEMIRRLDLRQ